MAESSFTSLGGGRWTTKNSNLVSVDESYSTLVHDETIYEAEVRIQPPPPKLWLTILKSPTGRPFLFTVMRDVAMEVFEGRKVEVALETIDEMAEWWERPPEEWELHRQVGRGDEQWLRLRGDLAAPFFGYNFVRGEDVQRDEDINRTITIDSFPQLMVPDYSAAEVRVRQQLEAATQLLEEANQRRRLSTAQVNDAIDRRRTMLTVPGDVPYPKNNRRLDGTRYKKR